MAYDWLQEPTVATTGVHVKDAHQNYLGTANPAWPRLQETMTPFQD